MIREILSYIPDYYHGVVYIYIQLISRGIMQSIRKVSTFLGNNTSTFVVSFFLFYFYTTTSHDSTVQIVCPSLVRLYTS